MDSELSVMVVDDDLLQLEVISDFVDQTSFLSLEGKYADPIKAIDPIITSNPDILLLDVEMPGLTGFDLINALENPPNIIMITGKADYASKAFDYNVTDFLVKPVDDYARFLKAINKVRDTQRTPKSFGRFIYIKEGSLLTKVDTNKILYFQAYGDYVKVITEDKTFVIYSTLSKIQMKLPEDFIKVHRSYIVKLDAIENIDASNLQIKDKIIPVSNSMRSKLMEKISTF